MLGKKTISILLIAAICLGFSRLAFAEAPLENELISSSISESIEAPIKAPSSSEETIPVDETSDESSSESLSSIESSSEESSSEESSSSSPSSSSSSSSEPASSSQPVSSSSESSIENTESSVIPPQSEHNNSSDNHVSSSVSDSSSPSSQAVASAEPNNEFWTEELAGILSGSCDWMQNTEHGTLYFLCMGAAGKPVVSQSINQYVADVSLKTSYKNITDIAHDVLNITFSGYHANNVRGKNLIKELVAYPHYDKQSLSSLAFALLALDSNTYSISHSSSISREAILDWILKFQNPDGGFSSLTFSDSNAFYTALALTALSSYQEKERVKNAVQEALLYLEEEQLPEGGYTSEGIPSSLADSSVLIALNSLKIPFTDSRFVKGEKTLVDTLLSYINSDNSFSQFPAAKGDLVSTEFAVLALASIKKQGSPFQLSTTLKETDSSGDGNIIFPSKPKLDLISYILYILLGALAVTLIISLLIVKLRSKSKKASPQLKEQTEEYKIEEQISDSEEKDAE